MIVALDKALDAPTESVGGKAKNLARLQDFGFPVPRSWVLPCSYYSELLRTSPVADQLASSEPLQPDVVAKLVAHLQQTKVPPELDNQLSGLPENVAVRSSASAEDSEEASFAGVHSSFLGIRGTEALWQAVRDCYCSLWTQRAQAYRQKLGFQHNEVNCAVLFCEMVESKVAGITFTCEPLTGQRDCLTINVGVGLGESVVGGKINPQRAFLSFQKGLLKVVTPGFPVYLSEEKLLTLARACIRINWALGAGEGAQDIEWCFDGRQFVFLQARPVTNLRRVTYEAMEQQPIIWSNANLKDILPGTQTTLSWNLTQGSIRNIGLASIEAVGGEIPKGMEFTKRICGRAYLDMTALQWALYDTFGVPPSRTLSDMGAVAPSLRLPHGALSLKAPLRAYRGLKLLLRLGALNWQLPAAIEKLESASRQAMNWNLKELSEEQLLSRLYLLRDNLFDFSKLYQFVNVRASLSVSVPQFVYRLLGPKKRVQWLAQGLGKGSRMTSAKQGKDLHHLAKLAEKEDEVRAYLVDPAGDPQGWKELAEDSPFRQAFQKYLDEFGHRAVYELKLENPRWADDPTYILEQIAVLVDQEPLEAVAPEPESFLVKLLKPLNRIASNALIDRERAKSALVWGLYPTRRIVIEVARRAQDEGVLLNEEDIFHWCWTDLECYLLGEWSGIGSDRLVEHRKAERKKWMSLENLPDFYVWDQHGEVANWDSRVRIKEPKSSSGSALQGVGVSPGLVTGCARILREPSEGKKLKVGDILVAPSTDPGWTPLFTRASAVVMEVGGELSHGAIVAREFGLPAVVGIPGLLQKLKDGDRIEVDGARGTVRILHL